VLLLPAFTLFLLMHRPGGHADPLRPRMLLMAAGIASLGALQYAWNFRGLWTDLEPPDSFVEAIAKFWFDVTKADWRGTMMAGVDRSELIERAAMWLWDARLQFGIAGLTAGLLGMLRLWVISRPWALLVATAYVINTVFAITYNVGDPHVFFLPGHAFTAVAIAALFSQRRPSWSIHVATLLLLAYAGWRAWDTWPSANRHGDHRADVLVGRVTAGVADTNAVLLSDMDWQSENALLYSARYERRQLAWRRASEVLLHLPFLVRDNHAIGRDIVLAGNAAARIAAAYGPLFPFVADNIPATGMADLAADTPRGTPYVLALLEPTPNEHLDADDFDAAVLTLAGSSAPRRSASRVQIWAGVAGEPGAAHHESNRPFRKTFSILGDPFPVRIESWLPFETFRRAGFGHVLRGREHVLTIERGVSLVWFARDGSPEVAYAAGLYAPQARLRIPSSVPQQVAMVPGAILDIAKRR